MICAICGKKVSGIGVDPLRPGENMVCLECLAEHGLEGIKEILREKWKRLNDGKSSM